MPETANNLDVKARQLCCPTIGVSQVWSIPWLLVVAAAAVYPNLLVSTTDPALNITVYNAHSGEH